VHKFLHKKFRGTINNNLIIITKLIIINYRLKCVVDFLYIFDFVFGFLIKKFLIFEIFVLNFYY